MATVLLIVNVCAIPYVAELIKIRLFPAVLLVLSVPIVCAALIVHVIVPGAAKFIALKEILSNVFAPVIAYV
jgi:hypothetical protein